jgi:arylsulfatase A-like enzyme
MTGAAMLKRTAVLAALGMLLGVLCSLLLALQAGLSHGYFSIGYGRSILLSWQVTTAGLVGPLMAATVCGGWLLSWRHRRRGDAPWLLGRLLAIGAGLGFWLQTASRLNRSYFAEDWLQPRAWGPLELPRALWRADVWLVNLSAALAALVLALLVGLLLHLLLVRRPARALRWWHGLQHPALLVVAPLLLAVPYVSARLICSSARDSASIILISIDTLRADHLGAYGCLRPTSPNLDRLAQESVLFEWAFSPAPNTPPAHMSLFTSLYPTVHGFTGHHDKLPDRRLTLTEYLRQRGYRTFATTDGGYMRGRVGFGQGFERFDDRRKGLAEAASLAIRWLDQQIGKDRFFLFIHCYDVHSPYEAPPPYAGLFADPRYQGEFQPSAERLAQIKRRVNRHPTEGHGLSAEEIAYMTARYDEGIRYADAVLGDFLQALTARGLLDSSWLIVLSDHGEEFTEHGSVLHEKLYHTVTRVPLIIRPPGRLPAAKRIGRIVELTDLLPTCLAIAGTAPVDLMQGESLLPLLQQDDPAWRDVAYSELPWFGRRRAVTTPDFHLLTSLDGGEVEVYRYHEDPLEQGLLPRTAWPATADSVLAGLLDWSRDQLDLAAQQKGTATAVTLDRATQEQLRALGYVQ